MSSPKRNDSSEDRLGLAIAFYIPAVMVAIWVGSIVLGGAMRGL